MDTFLIKAFQLILAFALLVIIHEFGHFIFSRMFGVRVEKFYMFFNPWFSLFKWKPKEYIAIPGFRKDLTKKKRSCKEDTEGNATSQPEDISAKQSKSLWGDTEYGIGWLPLGGYCKIAGMIDESMDTEQMKQPAQPWEFRSKPAWQRLLIMVAGVLFNFLLAIIIYAGIVFATGERYVPLQNARLGFAYSPVAEKAGFRDGDIPLAVDGQCVESPEAIMDIAQASKVTVLRDYGTAHPDTVDITLPSDFMLQLNKELEDSPEAGFFMTYRIPTKVMQVVPGEGADKAGILPGDRIIEVNSVATPSFDTFTAVITKMGGKTPVLTVVRPKNAEERVISQADTLRLPIRVSEAGRIGVQVESSPAAFYDFKEKKYSLLQSIPRGIEMGTDKLTSYAKSMKLVFTKEGAKSVGGFGAIGSIFPEKWDWIAFWNIAAFLSVALAFMNILPIPALDGGHVLFLLYEVIFRRKPNEKFMEYAQITGMVLLILLLIYANGMDIVRLFK